MTKNKNHTTVLKAMAQLEEIFGYYAILRKKYGMESLNMREVADRNP